LQRLPCGLRVRVWRFHSADPRATEFEPWAEESASVVWRSLGLVLQ
jgi:hypothetical protein